LAYQKTADFIEKYRENEDKKSIFNLPFINTID
jgi:hypothetical protein